MSKQSLWIRSDNAAGVSPQILEAIQACNQGVATSYGEDELSEQLDARFGQFFGAPVKVFAVASGTAANALALASLAGPGELILCHENAHVFTSECDATSQFSGGARFQTVPGADGRIDLASLSLSLESSLESSPESSRESGVLRNRSNPGSVRPVALTITQLTEAGSAYTADDLAAIGKLARNHGLRLHMDGARLANALAFLNLTAADITHKIGIDVLSFGATKNGAMYADAVVFFNPELATDFKTRMRRAGHDISKTRFMAAQLLAYLENNLWLHNARHANAIARELVLLLQQVPGAQVLHPVEGNIVFVALSADVVTKLAADGIHLRSWGHLDDGREWFRLVPSFRTERSELEKFAAALAIKLRVR